MPVGLARGQLQVLRIGPPVPIRVGDQWLAVDGHVLMSSRGIRLCW